MERHNLYMLRCNEKLTQNEIAAKTGVSRVTYAHIEKGKRDGSAAFWGNLQKTFNVPDEEMWKLQKIDKERE